jgi:hypothetical protein
MVPAKPLATGLAAAMKSHASLLALALRHNTYITAIKDKFYVRITYKIV